jgi:hypothetical protein
MLGFAVIAALAEAFDNWRDKRRKGPARDPIRWELGDRIFERSPVLVGAFVWVYAVVVIAKWLARLAGDLRRSLRPPPRPSLKALPPPRDTAA